MWMPIRTRIGPEASASCAARAAASAPAPSGRRRRRRRPACPPRPRRALRTRRAGHGGARPAPRAYALAPSSCSSFVEPSTSVKRKVTVPDGRSRSTRRHHAPVRSLAKQHEVAVWEGHRATTALLAEPAAGFRDPGRVPRLGQRWGNKTHRSGPTWRRWLVKVIALTKSTVQTHRDPPRLIRATLIPRSQVRSLHGPLRQRSGPISPG